jgi:hypothetical protein
MKIDNLYIEARTDSWRDVNALLKQQIELWPDDIDTIVFQLYFLIDLALEGPVREQIAFEKEASEIGHEVDMIFMSTHSRFNRNPEYLFFFGYFLRLMDWHFGDEIRGIADKMCRTAFDLEPNNILYEWGANRPSNCLRKQVLARPGVISWLETKGDYGFYIISVLNSETPSDI